MRKRKGRGLRLEVEKRFRELESGGYSAAQIYKKLTEEFGDVGVTERTIRTYVKACRPPDPSGTWSLADDSEESAFLLDVLQIEALKTEGRLARLTRKEAEWIVRIKHAVPHLPPSPALAFAREYMICESEGQDTAHLDMALAFWPSPQQSTEVAEKFSALHRGLHRDLWPGRPVVLWNRWGWALGAPGEPDPDAPDPSPVSRGRKATVRRRNA